MTTIYGFDTETTMFEFVNAPTLFQWCLISDTEEFNGCTPESFREQIQHIYDNLRENVIIVAHNLGFDYYMTMLFEVLKLQNNATFKIRTLRSPSLAFFTKKVTYWETPDGEKIYFKRDFGGHTKLKRKQKTFRLQFTDLSNYFLGYPRLVDVAKSFGVAGKFDPESMYTFNLLHFMYGTGITIDDYLKGFMAMYEYCRQDSVIVRDVMHMILDDNLEDVGFRFTVNSLGYAVLKQNSGWKKFDRPDWVIQKERMALHGGRSGFNPKYVRQGKRGYSYDVHSMYPYCLRTMKVPIAYKSKMSLEGGDYKAQDTYKMLQEIFESEDEQALITAQVRLNAPVLPYRKNVPDGYRLCFDHEDENGEQVTVTGIWCIDEFYPALRDHEIELGNVTQVILYHAQRGIFADFVDYYYNMKANSPKNSPQYSKAKLFLNGAGYGKFVERMRIDISAERFLSLPRENIETLIDIYWKDKNVPKELRFGKIDISNSRGQKAEIDVIGQDYHVSLIPTYKDTEITRESFGACSIVGVIITGMARRKLWEEGMRGNDLIRYDTDGITLTHRLDERFLHENELGKWALEKCIKSDPIDYCTYTVYGKKDYRCQHFIKMKGVVKTDIMGNEILNQETHDNDEWEYYILNKPMESLRRNLMPFTIGKQSKTRKY